MIDELHHHRGEKMRQLSSHFFFMVKSRDRIDMELCIGEIPARRLLTLTRARTQALKEA